MKLEYKRIKRDVRNLTIIPIGILFKNYAAPSFLFGILMLTLYQTSFTSLIDIFIISFLILFVPFAMNAIQSSVNYIKIYKTIDVDVDTELDDIKPYPLEQFGRIPLSKLFSDTAIFTQVLAILLSIFVSFVIFSSSNYISVKTQKTFPIVSDSNSQCAIVYQNSQYAILENVDINDKSIIINTSRQKIIKINDLEYEYRSFDEVIKK